MRYLLAIFLPPVAVLISGKPFQALLNIFLCLFFFIPGILHALFVVYNYYNDKQADRIEFKLNGSKPVVSSPIDYNSIPLETNKGKLLSLNSILTRKFSIMLLFAVFVIVIIIAIAMSGDNKNISSVNDPSQNNYISIIIPTYTIVDRDIYDAPVKTQITLSAVISGKITKEGLEQLLQNLYDEANATRDFNYHGGKPTHVFVYLYQSKEHFESGIGQHIAMLSKAGDSALIDTHIKTELIAKLNAIPEVKYGLSEEERKEVFISIIFAEENARIESEKLYPNPNPLDPNYSSINVKEIIRKQTEVLNKLDAKYKLEVADRFGISKEQLNKISTEGMMNNWPMPPHTLP